MSELQPLPKKRIHHARDGVHIFINPYGAQKLVTDDAGARVIELMDRAADGEALVDLISRELGIHPYEAATRLIAFSELLSARRMSEWAPEGGGGIPQPNLGFLEVTRQCATRCRLCYVDSGVDRPDTLAEREIFDVIDQMADMGIAFVALSGGDPLTRKDLVEILEYIALEKKLTAGLSTSLLTLTEPIARRMKDLGVLVQVSLDGSKPEVNDWNRGEGSFERTMRGVELLNRFGIPFRFACVINRHNLGDLEEMVELSRKFGAQEITFGKIKMAGRAKGQENEACPTREDLAAAYYSLYRTAIDMGRIGLTVSCKHNQAFHTGLQDRVGCLPCGAGRTFVQVSYNGDIIPCSLLSGVGRFILGNVRTDRLKDVWENSPILEFFRNTTVEDIAVCRNCTAKYFCGGGCRGDAFLSHGDLLGACSDCADLVFYYDTILDRGCNRKNMVAF